MMLTKTDGRPAIPRDGKHCDLCGCSQPAVRCDKCGRQAFCLSCDDMYHRHPKRRFHLRKAVDAAPPQRPALPAKGGGTLGGDPSKMPLPPPRKKKFFDTFRKRSPSGEGSPPLPKKEWTFGSIKNKFMSNRPLPPLPDTNGPEETTTTNKHDLTFIHKKVDEKPPQLPQRSLKPNELSRGLHENGNQQSSTNGVRNGTLNPSHMSRNNGYGEENQWDNRPTEHHPNPNTLMRQPGYIYPGNPGYPGPMSSSTTDLHTMQQHPQYPYPPMAYPHYPVYPGQYPGGYFGSSFANLSTTENDQSSDHSDVSRQGGGKKNQFRKRAKRSQSVLMDRMAYPGGQFFPPFGPFPPGYGPWGGSFPLPPAADHPPRSPSGSVRSLSRARTRRRTKKTTSDEDEEFSNVSSSPLSRPSSSSGRQQKTKVPPSSSVKKFVTSSSSSEEEFEDAQRSRTERVPRRDSDPKKFSSPVPRSPQMQQKKFFYKQKKSETLRSSDAEDIQQKAARQTSPSRDINAGPSTESPTSPAPFIPPSQWECVHCTFINSAGNRICQVCCKTATAEVPPMDGRNSAGTSPTDGRTSAMSADGRNSAGPSPADSRNKIDGRTSAGKQVADGRISAGQLPADGRTSSELSCSSPEKRMEEDEDVDTRRTKQDMAVLNSALDEAEKEISRGLEELMKLKEDFPPSRPTPPPQNKPESKPPQTPPPGQSKPVYKSSGKLRNASILDKITTPQTKTTSTSTCTETQTSTSSDHVIEARRGQTSSTTDQFTEARRGSNSSTTSDAYNSPMAQSPILQRTSPIQGAVKKGPKKDTSIQTDDLMDYRARAEDEAYFGRPSNGYGYRYGDGMTSPVPSMYHHPVMQRSHSRASLFTGRMTDMGPLDYGLGPSPMYRSVSRSSLTGDYPENSFADFHNLRKPAYYLSMEELVERRRQDSIRAQGLELVRMIREAEQQGFTADDIQVALHNCPPGQPPVEWLQENWRQLAAQVVAMAANYANEKRENDVGVVSDVEAREALRLHKGNVWPAVTECVESRQRKFLELKARGKFSTKDITDALSANQGDVELAYAKLSKSSSKPFLMRIWGAGEGAQNQDIPPKAAPTNAKDQQDFYYKDRDDIQSTGTWDEDDVEWDEDYDEEEEEEEEEQGDLEDLQTCHEDLAIKTPDSDRSDYCDAFGSNTLERYTKLPTAEPEVKLERRGSFLSRLGGLKRNDKDSRRSSQIDLSSPESTKDNISQENVVPSPDQSKSYNPISVIKNTISAIRDTVGGSKNEKKLPCAAPERRTIVVKGQIPQDSSGIASGVDSGVMLTYVKPLKDSEATLLETTTVSHEFGDKKLTKNESKDLPVETPINVNVNQELTSSTSDSKNKIGESVSSETVSSASVKAEETKLDSSHDKVNSKLQDMTSTKETNLSQDNSSKVIHDDDRSTSNSKDKSSQPSKTSKFSFKNNLENSVKDLKSEQKTQKFVEDTKASVTKESKTIFSPETSSSSNKEFITKTNKVEQKEKTKYSLEKESLVNKLPSDDASPSVSDKIDKREKPIKSKNEAETEIPNSNDKNIISVVKSEKRPKSDEPKDIEASGSKNVLLDVRTEHNDSHLTNTSTTIHPSASIELTKIIESNSNIPKSIETSSLGKEESQIIEEVSNKFVENASECSTDKLDHKTVQDDDANALSREVEIPLIDDVDTSLEDTPSKKNGRESKSPTFESMEPIHSSTFKRSISNQSSEWKIESKMSSETLSLETIESQTSSTNISNDPTAMIETNQAVTSQKTSVNAEAPVQRVEMCAGTGNDSAKESLKIVENKITKEMKEAASNLITSKLKKSVRLKEADKSQMTPSSSTNTTAEIMEDNSSSLQSNSLSCLESTPQTTTESDSVNQTNLSQNEEPHSESNLQKENSSTSTSPKLDNCFSFQSSLNNEEISNDSTALEYSNSESSQEIKALDTSAFVHSSSTPVTSLPNTSISTISTSDASSGPFVTASAFSDSNATPASISSAVLSTASTTVTSVPYGNGITPFTSVSDSSSPATYVISTSVSNASTIVSDAPTSSVTSPVGASVPTASLSTACLSTTIKSNSKASANTAISPSDASFTSFSTASTTTTSSADVSAPITSDPNASLSNTSLSTTSITPVPDDASLQTASISTTSTTVTSPSDASISTASTSTPPTLNASISTDSTTTSTSADTLTTSSISASSEPNASIPTDSTTTSTSTPNAGDVSTPISTVAPITSTNASSVITSAPNASSPITSTPNASIATASTTPISNNTSTPALTKQTSTDNDVTDDDSSEPISPMAALRHRFEGLVEDGGSVVGPIRPASPFRRMSFRSIKGAIALERNRDSSLEKPWFLPKPKAIETKKPLPKRSLKQQMETERKVRQMVADRKVRTYRKAEIVVQLMDMNFEEEEAIMAATECSNFEMALSYLQQECLLCTGHFPVSHIISMVHCEHKACRDCIRAYFTVQIRDRNIMELLCPFCNEPDIGDDDIAHDYFNHLDMMLKKLVDPEIHELFQRKLRDRVLMRDPSFRWCSKCSSGFLAMENLKLLVCPDCNAVTCSSCRRPWERDHQGISCEAFARLKDGNDNEAQAVSLAKQLTEDGIDCPRCHFRYALAKGGCMHFRCIQCQHDFCSGCYRPFKMGKKCGVSEFCSKLGLHAHHPRNCLFYLRDKDPEDLQRLLDMSGIKYDRDPPESAGTEEDGDGEEKRRSVCQVMEQKETADGMVDDCCGKEVEAGFAGLCRLHYVEYLGQLVNRHQVDPIQIFENDDLELVLRRADIRLPPKRYRESEESYREKLVNLIHEELPLDKMDGS